MSEPAETRLVNTRLQLDCYDRRYIDVHELADQVNVVIADLSRPDLSAWQESARDLYDNETQMHRVSMDFNVWR